MKLYSYLARPGGREQVGDRLTRFIALDLATFYSAESLDKFGPVSAPAPTGTRPERDERSTRNSWGKLEIFESTVHTHREQGPTIEWKRGRKGRGKEGETLEEEEGKRRGI